MSETTQSFSYSLKPCSLHGHDYNTPERNILSQIINARRNVQIEVFSGINIRSRLRHCPMDVFSRNKKPMLFAIFQR